jgi:DAACS family dicarboxylate/amino acid:cation (Na+ or H+) symporter
MKLHSRILVGLLVGLAAGIVTNLMIANSLIDRGSVEFSIRNITDPIGQIFLRLLFMIVIPLVFASLTLGVFKLGDVQKLGRIGIRTIVFFLGLTTVAVVIGLVLVNIGHPGKGFDPDVQADLLQTYGGGMADVIARSQSIDFTMMTFVDMMLPRNVLRAVVDMQMLPLIVISILFGFVMTRMSAEVSGSLSRGLIGLNDFSIYVVGMAMKLAPYAVPCLVFSITARFGFSILKPLGLYVVLVFTGYVLHLVGVYSLILQFIARVNPLRFFQSIKSVMITAFSTSSSNATLPTTIKVSEEQLGISPTLAGFVLPLGATTNMNGTALYEGMTVLFLAEVFGVDLTLGQQALVVVMSVLTAIGTAGIPGGSLPLIVLVMQAVGVPAEGIGIILGVDRILDMGRTVLNVTGDVTAVAVVARLEGEPVRFQDRLRMEEG